MANNDDALNAINNKLSVIVNLLMKKEEMSVKEKVAFMDGLNMPNKDASQIIRITENHYKVEKSLLNKKSKNNEKANSTNNISGELQNGKGIEQRNSAVTA